MSTTAAPTPDGPAPRAYDLGKRADTMSATRRRIAEAALRLFSDHDYDQVTLQDIAKAAGVSHQTVLNHFESKGGVLAGVAELAREPVEEAYSRGIPGDVASVVRVTVDRYELMGDSNVRWAVLGSRVPEIGELMDGARAHFQSWLAEMFAASLPTPKAARQRGIDGLHAALDVYTWKLLRRDFGLSKTRTEAVMTDLVNGVLTQLPPT